MTNLDSILKTRHYFVNKGPSSQSDGFSSSHVQIWQLEYKIEHQRTDDESPLDCKEIKQVNPKGNQSWIFIGRIDAEAEILILCPPDAKSQLIRKDPDSGKDWSHEEKGMAEYETVVWHHQLNGHEFEQASGDGEGQGSLVCCSPWGRKELDMTEWLNWTELNIIVINSSKYNPV